MVKVLEIIEWKYFLISFSIGMLYIYITDIERPVMMIYPNPNNYDKIVMKDLMDTCYKLNMKEVSCYENENIVNVDETKSTEISNRYNRNIYSLLFENPNEKKNE